MNCCSDCKYLDLTQKKGCKYVCTNKKRRLHWTKKYVQNGFVVLRAKGAYACKMGFEPK